MGRLTPAEKQKLYRERLKKNEQRYYNLKIKDAKRAKENRQKFLENSSKKIVCKKRKLEVLQVQKWRLQKSVKFQLSAENISSKSTYKSWQSRKSR